MPSVPVVLDKRNRPEPHSGAVKVLMCHMYGRSRDYKWGKGEGILTQLAYTEFRDMPSEALLEQAAANPASQLQYSPLWFPTHSESTLENYIINSTQLSQKPYPPTNCFELFFFETNLNQSNYP